MPTNEKSAQLEFDEIPTSKTFTWAVPSVNYGSSHLYWPSALVPKPLGSAETFPSSWLWDGRGRVCQIQQHPQPLSSIFFSIVFSSASLARLFSIKHFFKDLMGSLADQWSFPAAKMNQEIERETHAWNRANNDRL